MNTTGQENFEEVFMKGETVRIKVEPGLYDDDAPIFGDYPVENIKVEPELLFKDEPQSDPIEVPEMTATMQDIGQEENSSGDETQYHNKIEACSLRVTRKRTRNTSTQVNSKPKNKVKKLCKILPKTDIRHNTTQISSKTQNKQANKTQNKQDNKTQNKCTDETQNISENDPIECDMCTYTYKNKSLKNVKKFKCYKSHIQCKLCGNIYSNYEAFQSHFNNEHRNIEDLIIPTKCDECNDTFFTERGLNLHKYQNHNKNHKNIIENIEYETENTEISDEKKQINLLKNEIALRKKNESIGHLNFTVYCIKCSQDYVEKTYLDIHLENCITKDNKKNFQCPFCGVLKSNTKLFNHIKIHLDKPITYCNFCDISFFTKYNFQCHFDKYHKIATTLRSPASNLPSMVTLENNDIIESNIKQEIIPEIQELDIEIENTILELKNQIMIKDPTILKNSKVLIFCNECKKEYKIMNYIDHIVNCCAYINFKCSLCSFFSNTFTVSEYLCHIKIHLNHFTKLFDCEYCDVLFINHCNYRMHCAHKNHAVKYF